MKSHRLYWLWHDIYGFLFQQLIGSAEKVKGQSLVLPPQTCQYETKPHYWIRLCRPRCTFPPVCIYLPSTHSDIAKASGQHRQEALPKILSASPMTGHLGLSLLLSFKSKGLAVSTISLPRYGLAVANRFFSGTAKRNWPINQTWHSMNSEAVYIRYILACTQCWPHVHRSLQGSNRKAQKMGIGKEWREEWGHYIEPQVEVDSREHPWSFGGVYLESRWSPGVCAPVTSQSPWSPQTKILGLQMDSTRTPCGSKLCDLKLFQSQKQNATWGVEPQTTPFMIM